MVIPPSWQATELGNILLENEGCWVSYYRIGDSWLKHSIFPDNYPIARIETSNLTDKELAAHITKCYAGWHVLKLNLPGIKLENERVVGSDWFNETLDTALDLIGELAEHVSKQ